MSLRNCDKTKGDARKSSKRFGCEVPRIFTPPLRKLEPRNKATESRTCGYAVIDFAEKILGVDLLPWQKWLLIHALELLPDSLGGGFRFRTIVVLVARQNGKSMLSQVLALWFLYVYGYETVLGTAQDLDTAEEVWEGAIEFVEGDDAIPALAALKKKIWRVNGKKSLQLTTGQRYKVKAGNRSSGRGLSGDLILLDELREHRNWDAWAAITKTTMARNDALIWCMSNAGDAGSVVLHSLRKSAHETLGDPDGICSTKLVGVVEPDPDDDDLVSDPDTLALFEWSSPVDSGKWDRDAWAQANPSLGYLIGERNLVSAARTDPDWVFKAECMCQWSQGNVDGPFPPGAWEACLDSASAVPEDSPVVYGVDVSWDRLTAYIGVAGFRADGRPHVEVVAMRAGVEWVKHWFKERCATGKQMQVAIQERGAPASSLIEELETIDGVEVLKLGGTDLGIACARFFDSVKAGMPDSTEDEDAEELLPLAHLVQPVLDVAAATAVIKPSADAWFWDRRKSLQDAAPLMAVTAALWGLNRKSLEKKFVSAYEDSRLIVV